MYASWLTVFRPHGYGVTRMDAGSLDVLADDLSAHHVFDDDVLHALRIHPIIQSGHPSGARESRKPTAQRGRRFRGEDLSHQHIGALRTSPETALPCHF